MVGFQLLDKVSDLVGILRGGVDGGEYLLVNGQD